MRPVQQACSTYWCSADDRPRGDYAKLGVVVQDHGSADDNATDHDDHVAADHDDYALRLLGECQLLGLVGSEEKLLLHRYEHRMHLDHLDHLDLDLHHLDLDHLDLDFDHDHEHHRTV